MRVIKFILMIVLAVVIKVYIINKNNEDSNADRIDREIRASIRSEYAHLTGPMPMVLDTAKLRANAARIREMQAMQERLAESQENMKETIEAYAKRYAESNNLNFTPPITLDTAKLRADAARLREMKKHFDETNKIYDESIEVFKKDSEASQQPSHEEKPTPQQSLHEVKPVIQQPLQEVKPVTL